MKTLEDIIKELETCQLPSVFYVADDYTVGRLIRDLKEIRDSEKE